MRPSSPELEEFYGQSLNCLDKGFVKLVDYMGTEKSIINAARVSYSEGTKVVREDVDLLRYLMRNKHTSPLEMCEIEIHAKLPIFVARQWIRHRTANVNEKSARYSILENEFYVPNSKDIHKQSTTNKQGRDTSEENQLSVFMQKMLRIDMLEANQDAFGTYNELINTGVAREIARTVTPVSTYTEWYWKVDLHNLLHFCNLRLHSHAQYEIRVYAEAIYKMLQAWVPNVCQAFEDYTLNAHTFSAQEMEMLKHILTSHLEGKDINRAWFKETADDYNLGSKRERSNFLQALNLNLTR